MEYEWNRMFFFHHILIKSFRWIMHSMTTNIKWKWVLISCCVTKILIVSCCVLYLCAEHFTCVVKVLYSLQFTQALAALSIRFSREERLAWSNTGAAKKVRPMSYTSQPSHPITHPAKHQSKSFLTHTSVNWLWDWLTMHTTFQGLVLCVSQTKWWPLWFWNKLLCMYHSLLLHKSQ